MERLGCRIEAGEGEFGLHVGRVKDGQPTPPTQAKSIAVASSELIEHVEEHAKNRDSRIVIRIAIAHIAVAMSDFYSLCLMAMHRYAVRPFSLRNHCFRLRRCWWKVGLVFLLSA